MQERREQLVRRWQVAIGRTSFVSLEAAEVRARLSSLADQAFTAVYADTLDPQSGTGIGIALAKLGYILPEALGATIDVLGEGLLADVPSTQAAELQPRVAALLGAIATGFSKQARVIVLEEQEAVRGALLELRQRAEDALRESEERFRAVFQDSAIGIAISDLNGRIVETNPALRAMLGYSAVEMVGRAFAEFAHPDDLPSGRDAYRDVLAGRTNRFEMEQRFVDREGKVVWGYVVVSLGRGADGRPQFTISMCEDITERKRAEAERLELLRAQAARTEAEAAQRRMAFLAEISTQLASSLDYATTLQRITRAIVPAVADWCTLNVLSADGGLRNEVTAHVDPRHEKLAVDMRRRFPRRAEDNRSPVLQVLSSREPRLIEAVDEALLRDISQNEEHLQLWRELGPRCVMIVPLVAHNRTLGTLSMIATAHSTRQFTTQDLALAEDIGRRAAMAIENAQLYAQAQTAAVVAEDAVRLRDEFLSVAAHELKTPVTSLRGFAQLTLRALDESGDIDRRRLQTALHVVDQQSQKLTRLVAQLLDVSRLQSGRLAVDLRDADLSHLVAEVVRTIQSQSDRHELVADIPPAVAARVDPIRLEQVLTNLLDNAMKYSPRGGRIEVELSDRDPSMLQLCVRDHGIGVPLEHREHIFERFYQADTSGQHAGGMGLGLYISQQIMELHGGIIRAEFPPDGGTRFIVELPRPARASVPHPAA